ncbi:hypothetical protein Pcinc_035734, partial [Petrolisthes cinctipes]
CVRGGIYLDLCLVVLVVMVVVVEITTTTESPPLHHHHSSPTPTTTTPTHHHHHHSPTNNTNNNTNTNSSPPSPSLPTTNTTNSPPSLNNTNSSPTPSPPSPTNTTNTIPPPSVARRSLLSSYVSQQQYRRRVSNQYQPNPAESFVVDLDPEASSSVSSSSGSPYFEAFNLMEENADVIFDQEDMLNERVYDCKATQEEYGSLSIPRPASQLPGPRSWPIVGCLPYMLRHKAFDPQRVYLFWKAVRQEFGPIFRKDMPGHPRLVFITQPEDLETLLRSTMYNPLRPGMASLKKIRSGGGADGNTHLHDHIFQGRAGILAEQEDEWWRVRRVVQRPVTSGALVSRYLPQMDNVAKEFISRIRMLRDESGEVPDSFNTELYKWALESLGTIALDRRLGLLDDEDLPTTSQSLRLIHLAQQLLTALHETENVKLWQYFPTDSIRKLQEAHQVFTDVALEAISDTEQLLASRPNRLNHHNHGAGSSSCPFHPHLVIDPGRERGGGGRGGGGETRKKRNREDDVRGGGEETRKKRNREDDVRGGGGGGGASSSSSSSREKGEGIGGWEAREEKGRHWTVDLKARGSTRGVLEEEEETSSLLETLLRTPELSREDVLTFILDMIATGIDTTSHAVGNVLYLLARHPEIQRKLQKEIDTVVGNREHLSPHHLNSLPYLKAVFRESLRVMPVNVGIVRRLTRDTVLGGYIVPRGWQVVAPTMLMNHEESIFPRACEFLPERFLRGGSPCSPRHHFAFLPFSYGSRMCVGRKIAYQEIFCLVVRVMSEFNVEYHGSEEVHLINRLSYGPSRPLTLTFRDRRTLQTGYMAARYKHVAVTGPPGVGKTTLVEKVVKALQLRGSPCSGFYTREVREAGRRSGFDVVTLTGECGVLARVKPERTAGRPEPRVGQYVVDLPAFESLVLPLLQSTRGTIPHIVVLDEIGKMELMSRKFEMEVKQLLTQSHITLLVTIPIPKGRPIPLVEQLRNHSDCLVVNLSRNNRDDTTIIDNILSTLTTSINTGAHH